MDHQNLQTDDARLERAKQLYEQAVFGGDTGALAIAGDVLDGVEADLALARGRIMHARFLAERKPDEEELVLFNRSAALYHKHGDVRGEAEAQFWVGTYHQVVVGDPAAALPHHERSFALAAEAGDKLTLSYAVRHLAFADMAAGRMETARERLEESVRLRRELGFTPGVAAGLLALADLAAEVGDKDDAAALLDEADSSARACGADGVLRWIEEARAELSV